MFSTPLDKFVELLQRSGLVRSEEIDSLRAEFPFTLTDQFAVDEFCRELIDKGVLTTWQCDKLRQGKWKGFFVDGYCILRHLGKDKTSAMFLCREVATGRLVAMRVTPPGLTPDGAFHYEFHDPPPDVVLNG